MVDDRRPQQYTHTATLISSLSPLYVGLVDLLIRLCYYFGLAVPLLGPSDHSRCDLALSVFASKCQGECYA